MRISIGSGEKRIDDFINCDYDPLTNPDYCFDLEKDPFPFPDNSVDEVLASHVLEHLGDGYFHCIKELYRVCKHGAVIHVNVPHHRNDNFADDPTHKRPITVRGLKLFSKSFSVESKTLKKYREGIKSQRKYRTKEYVIKKPLYNI
jgi:predicted SAM-dependent methyltransferase